MNYRLTRNPPTQAVSLPGQALQYAAIAQATHSAAQDARRRRCRKSTGARAAAIATQIRARKPTSQPFAKKRRRISAREKSAARVHVLRADDSCARVHSRLSREDACIVPR